MFLYSPVVLNAKNRAPGAVSLRHFPVNEPIQTFHDLYGLNPLFLKLIMQNWWEFISTA